MIVLIKQSIDLLRLGMSVKINGNEKITKKISSFLI